MEEYLKAHEAKTWNLAFSKLQININTVIIDGFFTTHIWRDGKLKKRSKREKLLRKCFFLINVWKFKVMVVNLRFADCFF